MKHRMDTISTSITEDLSERRGEASQGMLRVWFLRFSLRYYTCYIVHGHDMFRIFLLNAIYAT